MFMPAEPGTGRLRPDPGRVAAVPSTPCDWGAMLRGLEASQLEIEKHVIENDGLTAMAEPDRARIAMARWKLTQAVGRRAKLLEEQVYPSLQRYGPAEAGPLVRRLRESGAAFLAESVRAMGSWTIDRVVADWRGFCAVSRSRRKSLCSRMNEERDLLHPILRTLAAARC
jgi:hypothetical protein